VHRFVERATRHIRPASLRLVVCYVLIIHLQNGGRHNTIEMQIRNTTVHENQIFFISTTEEKLFNLLLRRVEQCHLSTTEMFSLLFSYIRITNFYNRFNIQLKERDVKFKWRFLHLLTIPKLIHGKYEKPNWYATRLHAGLLSVSSAE
jgi:hypothetical protein